MTTLSTHVLDTSTGEPAVGIKVHLSVREGERWSLVGEAMTDSAGRVAGFGELNGGRYRLGFETGEYGSDFFPYVHVVFEVDPARPRYHIPLLLGPYGFTTYRGS
jgi:5-hydroxyisourate hydrolase